MTHVDRLADRHTRLLDRHRSTFGRHAFDKVVFVADPAFLQTFAGQVTWATTLNLAARLYSGLRQVRLCLPASITRLPNVYFPNDQQDLLAASQAMLGQLNPGCFEVHVGAPEQAGDWIWVHVGDGAPERPHVIAIAGRGWLACIGSDAWNALPDDENPIGPMIAACFGVAELYKALYPPTDYAGPETHVVSAYDYAAPDIQPAPPAELRLPRSYVAGAGAVGMAFLWALSCCPWLSASSNLQVVDDDRIDDTNLNRCGLAILADLDAEAECEKVSIAARELRRQSFTPGVHAETWQAFMARAENQSNRDFELVVSCVDKYEARRAVQYTRPPKLLLSAGTGDFLLVVSRHVLNDGLACGLCYQRRDPELDCGSATEVARDAFAIEPDPSISFVSVLAGILLAAEYLKEINPAWHGVRRRAVRANVLRGTVRTLERAKDVNCNCGSKYVAAGYEAIWGARSKPT